MGILSRSQANSTGLYVLNIVLIQKLSIFFPQVSEQIKISIPFMKVASLIKQQEKVSLHFLKYKIKKKKKKKVPRGVIKNKTLRNK